MRSNEYNNIEKIISILINDDFKKKKILNESNKTALLDYINKELFNLKYYKALIENIKIKK